MTTPDQHVEVPVPEEAVERLAQALVCEVAGWQRYANQGEWLRFKHDRPSDLERYLERARVLLKAAAPFIAAKAVEECERCGDEREVYEVIASTPNGDECGTVPCPDCMSEACRACGNYNPSWSAPSPLWNAVMRGGSIGGEPKYDDLVCATCFMQLAEEQGVAAGFRVSAQEIHVELETVTPSGLVWDEECWLWVGPGG